MATSKKAAVVVTAPHSEEIWNPAIQAKTTEYGYWATMPTRPGKPTRDHFVRCSTDDVCQPTNDVQIEWHVGRRCYVHRGLLALSDEEHCAGGFQIVPLLVD